MGKPYQYELAALPKTIDWAMALDIRPIARILERAVGHPLVATGSGGSLSAAKLAAAFHQIAGGGFAKCATPLEMLVLKGLRPEESFLLLSAGGGNSDILAAFKQLAVREPRHLVAITGRLGTPLAKLARRFPASNCIELDVPSGKDGFLATNSLAAFCIILARGYHSVMASGEFSATELKRMIRDTEHWAAQIDAFTKLSAPLWSRDHLVVLYPPEAEAGAIDIESKFTEAALGHVQIADYRHFAHGRHHWLAKRGGGSAVLGFITPQWSKLAEGTLACLPKSVPVSRVQLPDDSFEAGVVSILTAIILAGCAGKHRGIDPGRPGVPPFGRKIYHLYWVPPHRSDAARHDFEAVAIERKMAAAFDGETHHHERESGWKYAHDHFCTRLERQRLRAVVFDYDGTLVFTEKRFDPLPPETAAWLVRLLRHGIAVGLASGRGKSLRETVQQAIPRRLWNRVVLGYYNGGQTGLLADDTLPKSLPAGPELAAMEDRICLSESLVGRIKVEARHSQLSVTPIGGLPIEKLWYIVMEIVGGTDPHRLKVVRSGHSVDVLAPDVSKLTVVEAVRNLVGAAREEVLKVGDQGRWPGNDCELLSEFPSLSVNEVSTDSDTCWNLAPRGILGPPALHNYLAAMKLGKGAFWMKLSRIRKGWR